MCRVQSHKVARLQIAVIRGQSKRGSSATPLGTADRTFLGGLPEGARMDARYLGLIGQLARTFKLGKAWSSGTHLPEAGHVGGPFALHFARPVASRLFPDMTRSELGG